MVIRTESNKVSIIIPNFNGLKNLKKNLPSVLKQAEKSGVVSEVIIVDDDSTDDSVDLIKELFINELTSSKLKIIENKKNLGFSSTVNKGVKEARGEIVVLLNTDIYPEEGFLEPILPHFKDLKVFAVGMMDRSVENGRVVLRGRGIGEWKRGFYFHKRGEVDKTDTSWVSGGSAAFRRSTFIKLGGFAEIYNPFYWEDIDLSYRAVKAGYKILFEPKSVVVHEHEKGAIRNEFQENEIKIISYRNQFIFVWRNADFREWLSHFFWLPYHLMKAALSGDFLFWRGLFSAFKKISKL